MLDTVDAALARFQVEPEPEAEVDLPPDASPLDYLCAVYRDPRQPPHRRMRAAIEALPFVHPKLMVSASFDGRSYAVQLEKAIARSGMMIEHDPG